MYGSRAVNGFSLYLLMDFMETHRDSDAGNANDGRADGTATELELAATEFLFDLLAEYLLLGSSRSNAMLDMRCRRMTDVLFNLGIICLLPRTDPRQIAREKKILSKFIAECTTQLSEARQSRNETSKVYLSAKTSETERSVISDQENSPVAGKSGRRNGAAEKGNRNFVMTIIRLIFKSRKSRETSKISSNSNGNEARRQTGSSVIENRINSLEETLDQLEQTLDVWDSLLQKEAVERLSAAMMENREKLLSGQTGFASDISDLYDEQTLVKIKEILDILERRAG